MTDWTPGLAAELRVQLERGIQTRWGRGPLVAALVEIDRLIADRNRWRQIAECATALQARLDAAIRVLESLRSNYWPESHERNVLDAAIAAARGEEVAGDK